MLDIRLLFTTTSSDCEGMMDPCDRVTDKANHIKHTTNNLIASVLNTMLSSHPIIRKQNLSAVFVICFTIISVGSPTQSCT